VSTAYLFPSTLQGLSDVSVSPGVGQNGYPLVWNNSLGKWQVPGTDTIPLTLGTAVFQTNPTPLPLTNGTLFFDGDRLKIRVGGITKTIAYLGDEIADQTNLNFDLSTGFSTLTTRYF